MPENAPAASASQKSSFLPLAPLVYIARRCIHKRFQATPSLAATGKRANIRFTATARTWLRSLVERHVVELFRRATRITGIMTPRAKTLKLPAVQVAMEEYYDIKLQPQDKVRVVSHRVCKLLAADHDLGRVSEAVSHAVDTYVYKVIDRYMHFAAVLLQMEERKTVTSAVLLRADKCMRE